MKKNMNKNVHFQTTNFVKIQNKMLSSESSHIKTDTIKY